MRLHSVIYYGVIHAALVLSVAALACFTPGPSFASSARIDGLGLQSDYVQDYVNVWHYPSTIVRYENLVSGDLGIKDESGGDLPEFEDNDADVPEQVVDQLEVLRLYGDVDGAGLPLVDGEIAGDRHRLAVLVENGELRQLHAIGPEIDARVQTGV